MIKVGDTLRFFSTLFSFTLSLMRPVLTHPEKSIRFTEKARFWCEMTNLYRRLYPNHSFRKMAKFYELSETNCRRYYYGIHHYIASDTYTQIREGACVDLQNVTP